MEGLSERQYAARVGLSRGAVQKAKAAGRLVPHADGSVNAAASDQRRAEFTDPSKTRSGADPGADGVDGAGADRPDQPRAPPPRN